MVNKYILQGIVLFIILLNYACKQAQRLEQSYLINGEITGLMEGQASLGRLELGSNEWQVIDSTPIVAGKFTFSGSLNSPYLYGIYINDSLGKISFFLENSTIDIKADVNHLREATIVGSKEDSVFRAYPLSAPFDSVIGRDIMKLHSSYAFSAFIAYYQFQRQKFSVETMDSIMNGFSAVVKQSTYYKHLTQIYEGVKRARVGKIAPEFSLPDLEGKVVKRSDFEGNYLLINFGASFQRYYNPQLVQAAHTFQDQPFSMVNISLDTNKLEWSKVIQEDSLTWTNLSALNGWGPVTDLYGVKYIPQNFLISPEGQILYKNIEYDDLDSVLSKLLL